MKDSKKSSVESSLNFDDSQKPHLYAGAIKISIDYVSKKEIFDVAVKWAEEDSNLLRAVVRGGGSEQIAIDFLYDAKDTPSVKNSGDFLDKVVNKFFTRYLDKKSITGWDYSNKAALVK